MVYIPLIISIIFLCIPFLTHVEYGYYQLLRFVVCGSAAYSAYIFFKIGIKPILWVLVLIAIIFNPLFPLHFKREGWHAIDIATIIIQLIFFSIGMMHKGKKE